MESKKQLYPLKFIPIPSKRVWGGSNLIKKLGKEFYEADENGNERKLTADEAIGESWEIADMGAQDSVVANGWLAGTDYELAFPSSQETDREESGFTEM